MTTKAEVPVDVVERIGAYRVVRRLATGGTSDVLLAKAEGPHGFERTVVLKVLLSHFGKDDEVAKMFAREASAYARLSHPAIVRLFDFFAVPNPNDPRKSGQLVMVLEFVDGPPLARLKSMAKAIGKELDDKASIYIAACIFDALAAAHSAVDDAQIPAPVIHRDVNPSNVLIPWDGYPKLADFGVAKVTGLGHQSVVGMIKGTYGYMAPEQVMGGETVTPRADVYAAGIILWELLTKRRAFQRGALPEVEALRAMAEPRLPALESIRSDVDRGVREALRRCLEPRAEKRKITAEEMVSILHSVVSPDQGRERLMSLLGLVRNDARAANAQASQAPPAMPVNQRRGEPLLPDIVIPGSPRMAPDFSPHTLSGVAPPATRQGVAPPAASGLVPKGAPPRPIPSLPSSAKLQAAKPTSLPTTTLSSAGMPAIAAAPPDANVRDLLSMPTRPAMPAVSAPPVPPPPQRTASRPGMPAVGALPPLEGPPRTKSASARLAVSLPPEALEEAPPTRPLNSILDSLGEEADRMSRPPDSARGALKDLTGGLGLRDAIDEIMKSSSRMQAATPVNQSVPGGTPVPNSPAPGSGSDRPQMRETTRVPAGMTNTLIGLIPPAPAPMTSMFPQAEPSSPPGPNDIVTTPPGAVASDYPNADDAPESTPRDTTVVMEPMSPRVQSAPNNNKAMAQTVMMEARPHQMPPSGPIASAPGSEVKTGKMPKFTPAPMAAVQVPGQAAGLGAALSPSPEPPIVSHPPPQFIGSDPRPSTPVPSYGPAPAKKGLSVGGLAVGLIVLIAVGIAGLVAFVRVQAHRDNVDAGPYVAPQPTVTAVLPPTSAEPATSVVVPTPASGEPANAAPPDAGAPPAVVRDAAVAAPPPSTAPAAEPIADGMGLLKTTSAAPGRRIFVDTQVAGQTPETITLKCGAHKVKLGSSGVVQDIDVPCKGEVTVGDVKP